MLLASKRAVFTAVAVISAMVHQCVGPAVDTEPLIWGTCVLDDGAFRIRSQPTMSLAEARFEERSNVTCSLTGDTEAHPVAYRFEDIYNQGDGLKFSNEDVGYPMGLYPNPGNGPMVEKWGWGDGDFTVSSWFQGSFRNGSGYSNRSGAALPVPCVFHCLSS